MAFTKNPLKDGTKTKLKDYSVDLENRIEDATKVESIFGGTLINNVLINTDVKLDESALFNVFAGVTSFPAGGKVSPMRLDAPGFYWANGGWMTESGHAPSPFGMVFAWEVSAGNRFVVFIGTDNVTRTRVLFNGTWSDWKIL